ncbi:protein NO VEIN domain-containing protein [Gordonia iterans]
MVIQIRLSDRVNHTPAQIETDSLHRSWCGYDAGVSDEVLWEHNRGRWDLNEDRIANETYATFIHDGRIVAVYRIDGHERVSDPGPKGTKIALIGRPLAETDPVHRSMVGRAATHRGRNAINYLADTDTDIDEVSPVVVSRRAFLLTWNPDNWDWADFSRSILATDGDGVVGENWSTGGRTTGIHLGDLVFLLRQGKRGRGIIGSGQATDFSGDAGPDDEIIYNGPHWDGTGTLANYVDVMWDRLVEPLELLPIDELREEFPDQNWSPMASGTQIRPDVVDALEEKWARHIGEVRSRPDDGQRYAVNAAKRKAIEDAAQDWLMQHYRDEGWTVRDTRYGRPYDAVATRNGQTHYLEAKGTQSSGEAVFVTRGEVEHARNHHGNCVVGIWSGMRFTADGTIDPDAGETVVMPFEPDTGMLSALQYRWEWAAAEH